MKLFLAPMASITDMPFRLLMKRRFGVDYVISELISSHGLFYQDGKTRRLCEYHPDERPVGAQIFGYDTDKLVYAAQYLEGLGYDFVDINLGCPVQKVVQKGAGAGMCRDVPRLFVTLQKIQASIKIPLTIKIRIGWDASHINAQEIVARAYDIGIRWVAIHGRTRVQAYKGVSDWSLLQSIAWNYPEYVIGNGDIRGTDQYEKWAEPHPFLGVMVGRAALSYPWIFSEIRTSQACTVAPKNILEVIREYLAYLRLYRPDNARYVLLRLKKMAAWLSHGLPNASQFRLEVFRFKEEEGVEAVMDYIAQYFMPMNIEILRQRPVTPIYYGGEG